MNRLSSTALRAPLRVVAAAIAAVAMTLSLTALAASVAPVSAQNGMVVTAQHLATKVGVDVLKRGGNAVDAAVAVGYALAVVYPAAGNLGGGGFMTIQFGDGRKAFLDFREKAPLAAKADIFLPVRRGSDLALLNGLLRLVRDAGGVDTDFVTAYTEGWEPLNALLDEYPADQVANITGVD